MSSPMARPVGPTRFAEMSTSAPAPDPRSSTVSPSWRSATAVGTPQPSEAATAVPVAPSVSAPSYSAPPKTCASSASVSLIGPQEPASLCCAAAARAAAAYFSRTVSGVSAATGWPAEQPQRPPAAFVPQQASLASGSQQDCCASDAQHED